MKKFIYTLIVATIIVSCNEFDIEDQGFDLEALPESVSFNGSGDDWNVDDDTSEGSSYTLEVEAPNGTLSDIVVTYTLSGTATFGTDYTIAGATASGGSMTIVHDPSDIVAFDHGEIVVDVIADAATEGAETIIITLSGATRGSETIAVGRGGTDYGKSATLTVAAN